MQLDPGHFKTCLHYKNEFRQSQRSSQPEAEKSAIGQARRVCGCALKMHPHARHHRRRAPTECPSAGTEGARWWKTAAQARVHRSHFEEGSHPYREAVHNRYSISLFQSPGIPVPHNWITANCMLIRTSSHTSWWQKV